MGRKPLAEWQNRQCNCQTCKDMCKVPCWPSPEEAEDLIRRGYGPKLMLSSRLHPQEVRDILVICPARRGCERKEVSYTNENCIFQNKKGLCQLHGICKPIEGRLAICKGAEPANLRDRVALLWDNDKGRSVVLAWIKKFARNKKLHHKKLCEMYRESNNEL